LAVAALALILSPRDARSEENKPAAPIEWKPIVTQGFKVQVPADWTLKKTRKYGLAQHQGLWVYSNPNGHLKMRVRRSEDKGEAFAKAVEANMDRLLKRMDEEQILKKEFTKDDAGRDVYYAFVRGLLRVKDRMVPHMILRLIAQAKGERVTLTVAGTDEMLDVVPKIAEKIMETFDIVEPKPSPLIAPAAKSAAPGEKR
jgi:hypothetical protein